MAKRRVGRSRRVRPEHLAGRRPGVVHASVEISPAGEVYLDGLLFPAMGDDERGFFMADEVELRWRVRIPFSALRWTE